MPVVNILVIIGVLFIIIGLQLPKNNKTLRYSALVIGLILELAAAILALNPNGL